VFSGPLADYSIQLNPNGTLTVIHIAGKGNFKAPSNDGTDILRNIEQLKFSGRDDPGAAAGSATSCRT
jgi:hypothetical protein